MSISPFAEIIERSSKDNETIARAASQIRAAVTRGRRVTQEIMRFARPAEPALTEVDFCQWLSGAVQSIKPLLGTVNVTIEGCSPGTTAKIDKQQIEQVLANLLVNARDALGDRANGTIGIDVTCAGQRLDMAVRDNGSGMSAETMASIFEPFFTTKRTGTGLGLAVVKQIIESHGGSIDVESEPGCGTTFHVRLPLSC